MVAAGLMMTGFLMTGCAASSGTGGKNTTVESKNETDTHKESKNEGNTQIKSKDGENTHNQSINTHGESKSDSEQVASADETVSRSDVVEDGMTPVRGSALKDGVYQIDVDSSSSMFKITSCELTVKNGSMRAVMTMGGTGYLKLYMGTGDDAVNASEQEYIPFVETSGGAHTFEVPVEALDMGIPCSAFSKNKEKWYDRELVFRSDSLPADAFAEGVAVTAESLHLKDGFYTAEVVLGGGSGKASVESPARLRVEQGKVFATIVWGSANYDYMKVDGRKYELMNTEGNSTFEIPVAGFDRRLPIIADTIAMSQPHEIEYTLTFDSSTLKPEQNAGAGGTSAQTGGLSQKSDSAQKNRSSQNTGLAQSSSRNPDIGLKWERSMELRYADQFSVDYYEGGYAVITIRDTGSYLVVPEKKSIPQGLPDDITVIQQPLNQIYLVATSAMDLFRSLDSVERITLSGTDASGWYIEEAKQAMKAGRMSYAGKYNAPDYELILSRGCDLAVESTMIYHSPEVKEQLEKLGIPVLVERSSYESHPLGRMEWLKLYGVLLDKEEQAETCFAEHMKALDGIIGQAETVSKTTGSKTAGRQNSGKKVAFFHISPNGYVNVRKSGDYVAKMIELAGGTYVPENLTEQDSATSTMNMQMEAFYAAAKDADYIIYNSTIDGELRSMDELLSKSSLLADFKAVKEGHVWCAGKNMFQETMGLGNVILDIHRLLTEKKPDPAKMTCLYPLR